MIVTYSHKNQDSNHLLLFCFVIYLFIDNLIVGKVEFESWMSYFKNTKRFYFLWGFTVEKRKIHLVSWKKVTIHKNLGDLGNFSLRDRNKALLAKFCWRISTEHEAPWAQMLSAKY